MILPVITTEKLNIIKQEFLKYNVSGNRGNFYANINYTGGSYKIDRAAAEDLYNLELNHTKVDYYQPHGHTMYINVNDDKGGGWTSKELDTQANQNVSKSLLHHFEFGSPSLLETKTLAFGENLYSYDPQIAASIWRRVMFLRKQHLDQNLSGNFENIYEFKTIAKMYSTNDETWVTDKDNDKYGPTSVKEVSDSKFLYSHIFVKPIMPDQLQKNQVIAKIYYATDPGVDHDWSDDVDVEAKKIQTSGSKDLKVYFNQNIDKSDTISTDKVNNAYLVGEVKVDEYTHYDYSSGKVIKGYGLDGIKGDLVPYGFKGKYHRQINLKLNNVFDNVSINLTTNFDQPILDSSDGKVNLKITESHDENITLPTNVFDNEDIKQIRKGKINSLNGFYKLND